MLKQFLMRLLRSAIFVVVFFYLLMQTSGILAGGYTDDDFQQSVGFQNEDQNSLDAVFIGASPTFTSWSAPLAWGKYGIAVRTFANNSQPFVAAKYFLQLARQKQPDAIYLIAINGLYDRGALPVEQVYRTTNLIPLAAGRFALIDALCDGFGYSFFERIELYFPLIRFHSQWNSISRESFHKALEPYKGGFIGTTYFEGIENIEDRFYTTQEHAPLPDFTEKALRDLLEYCRTENVNVVFILSAQYRGEQILHWYNTMIREIKEYGFPLVNELDNFDKIGLDGTTDFYNGNHTNIHGALKITDYLSQYLIENYGFEDKRGDSAYASWDEAYEQYSEIVKPYLTDEEREWVERMPSI